MSRLLDASLRRSRAWIVPVVGLLLALAAIVGLGEAEREPTPTDALPDGYESTEVTTALEAFPQGDDSVAIVLFAADSALSKAQLAAAQDLFAQVAGDFADPTAGAGAAGLARSAGQAAVGRGRWLGGGRWVGGAGGGGRPDHRPGAQRGRHRRDRRDPCPGRRCDRDRRRPSASCVTRSTPTCPTASRPRSPGRRPSRPTWPRSSRAPTSGSSVRPPWWWRSC